ncbi:MAG: PDZ domain-containing protein [Chloroflexi bacterium]|nr:PDZ domain-containing protein [Chloroflexota bacterium]
MRPSASGSDPAHRRTIGALAFGTCFAAVIAITLSTLLPGISTRYYLLLPGRALPIAQRIEVPAELRHEVGDLSATVVLQKQAFFPEALVRAASPGVRVVPYISVIPRGQTPDEVTESSRRQMRESQVSAAIVALRALGHRAEVTGEGVRVTGVRPGTPAAARLKQNDIITALNGRAVATDVEIIEAMRAYRPGDRLSLTVRRGDDVLEQVVDTIAAPDDPNRPFVGIGIATHGYRARLPFDVRIDSRNAIGPSAGLIFALGIYDALTPGSLTNGVRVAGTGTIAASGTVGQVDGVAQKVLGAESAGYTVFLTPRQNYAEARRAAQNIRVIPVETFAQALDVLRGM